MNYNNLIGKGSEDNSQIDIRYGRKAGKEGKGVRTIAR